MIDLIDSNSEDVVFLTDSRSLLDSLAGHGEKGSDVNCKHIRTQKSDPTVDSSKLWYQRQ